MHRGPGWSGCLAVSGLRHTCSGSRRTRGLRVAAIWNHVGKSVVQPLFSLSGYLFFSGSAFIVFCLPSNPPPVVFVSFFSLFPLLSQCDGCLDVPVCGGAHTWLRGLLTMGASYCLGAGWSQWRPLDIPGTDLPLSSMQLLMESRGNFREQRTKTRACLEQIDFKLSKTLRISSTCNIL